MTMSFMRQATTSLLILVLLLLAGCATTEGSLDEAEPVFIEEEPVPQEEQAVAPQDSPRVEEAAPLSDEGEDPFAVAEAEPPVNTSPGKLEEVVVMK
jgi:hypothetical protein